MAILEMLYAENRMRVKAQVVYERNEIVWVGTIYTNSVLTIHNCAMEEAENHLCLTVNMNDMSIVFYGNSNFSGQNGLAYNFSGEYFSLNNKQIILENPPPRPSL